MLSLSGWRAFALSAFANAWGAVFGVSAGRGVLDDFMTPYPTRFVGIAFISLLGICVNPANADLYNRRCRILHGRRLGRLAPRGGIGAILYRHHSFNRRNDLHLVHAYQTANLMDDYVSEEDCSLELDRLEMMVDASAAGRLQRAQQSVALRLSHSKFQHSADLSVLGCSWAGSKPTGR